MAAKDAEVINNQDKKESTKYHTVNNCKAVEFSADLAVNKLIELNPMCEKLFYLLGCMPAGATIDILKVILDPEVDQYIDLLRNKDILEDETELDDA